MSATIPSRDISKRSAVSTSLAFPATTLLSQADKLARAEREVIANLQDQSIDEVLNTRANAKQLGATAWRIECACDAQIVAGAKSMRGRSRNGNGEELGVTAAVRKQAKRAGCTPSTVFKNAQIFKLIQQVESDIPEMSTSLRILNERKYFVVALTAADPVGALKIFIEKKTTLSRFRTTDAERLLAREGLTKKAAHQKAMEEGVRKLTAAGQRELDNLKRVIDIIKSEVLPKTRDEDARRIHLSYIEELNDHIQGSILKVPSQLRRTCIS